VRPSTLFVISGTGTGVGKTWFGAVTLGLLRSRGVRVAARKPAQSFAAGTHRTDAEVLAAATGEDATDVCVPERSYEVSLAPPMAAEALGRARFTIADLVGELTWPPEVVVGAVEGVGGPRSPLASDGDTVDLVDAIRPDVVVVVAPADLGAINAVRLAVAPFTDSPVVVALNRYDPDDSVHARNRTWLRDRVGLEIVTSPTALADHLESRV
jgi:dethiobiotin synthetase